MVVWMCVCVCEGGARTRGKEEAYVEKADATRLRDKKDEENRENRQTK